MENEEQILQPSNQNISIDLPSYQDILRMNKFLFFIITFIIYSYSLTVDVTLTNEKNIDLLFKDVLTAIFKLLNLHCRFKKII
jgi:hypothetical protein